MKQVAQALLNAQKQIKNAIKDAKNPHFKNNYATLESVIDATKEVANKCGILIIQGTGADEFGQYVNTTLIHAESGESISSKLYLHLDKPTMQGVGSAVSYGRRYLLASLFCITQEDDDANNASIKPVVKPAVKNIPAITKPQYNEIDNYRVDFGEKFVGKALWEIPVNALENTIIFLEDQAKRTGEPLTQKHKRFIELATCYVNQGEE